MKNRIYFFANFGEWDKQPYGGGEVGNRRTLQLMREMDFEIRLIERYVKVPRNNIWNRLRFFFRVANTVAKYTAVLLFGRRKQSLLHVVGFYGVMLPFDYLMVCIGKILGYKVIYEMRGGGADYFYDTMGVRYRKMFDSIVRKTSFIFSQGMENEQLIQRILPDKQFFYYPNFVMDDFYPDNYPEKPKDIVNILYFGRITPTKNIDIIIDTFSILFLKYKKIHLHIVGNYEDKSYFDSINELIINKGLQNHISILPACKHDTLKEILKDKHIYIFPTKEPREGHSNAMTEAMAWGVVPVATSQGFNRSVIDNNNLIVENLDAESFANVIGSLISSGNLDEISRSMYERVGKHYTQSIAFRRLKNEYSRLFGISR